jgi:hypothetical protein
MKKLMLFFLHTFVFVICFVVLQKGIFAICPNVVLGTDIASILIVVLVALFYGVFLKRGLFESALVCLCYFFMFMLLSTYTSISIDRSMTYHSLFLASKNLKLPKQDIELMFPSEVYRNLRLEDMKVQGFLKDINNTNEVDEYVFTPKTKVFTSVMLWLGEFYNINGRYFKIRSEIKKDIK